MHRFLKGQFIKVPRLCPPISKLIPIIHSIEETLGVNHADNGKIAFTGITEVAADMLARGCVGLRQVRDARAPRILGWGA